uniref:Uncharacterized protein n=1 Tax=Panthera leo TaxID=9689 RepID=A0A8C9DAK0_PANLE
MEELSLKQEIKRRTEKTMKAKPLTWGQMKKMTLEAEQILKKTGTLKTFTMFIAMMSPVLHCIRLYKPPTLYKTGIKIQKGCGTANG